MASHPARATLSSFFGPLVAAGLTLGVSGATAAPLTERDVTIADEIHIMQEFHNDTFGHAGQCARLESANFLKMNQLLVEFDRDVSGTHTAESTDEGGNSFKSLAGFNVVDLEIASIYIDKVLILQKDILMGGIWNECDITRSKYAFSAVARIISEYGNMAQRKLRDEESNAKPGAPAQSEPPPSVIYVDPDKLVPDFKVI